MADPEHEEHESFMEWRGPYQETNYYFRDDIPRLILVAQKAYEYIALSESRDAEVSTPV